MSGLPLPVIDLSSLASLQTEMADTHRLATQLGKAFETDGFAYLVNVPLTFTHEKVFSIAKSFFRLSEDKKLRLAKKTFQRENSNTYRG